MTAQPPLPAEKGEVAPATNEKKPKTKRKTAVASPEPVKAEPVKAEPVTSEVGEKKLAETKVGLQKEPAEAKASHRGRKKVEDARSCISKVWLSPDEAERIDKARGELSRGTWIRKTILKVAEDGNLPAVDAALMDDRFQPRVIVVNFRLTEDEMSVVDKSRGRQARCTWMREAALRVAYPESENRAA